MFRQSGTSDEQVEIEILVSSTESTHFSRPCQRRKYLIRVDGTPSSLRKKYGKWGEQRHIPADHIYIESDESNDTKNQNDGDVVNCEVAANMGGLEKPTLVAYSSSSGDEAEAIKAQVDPENHGSHREPLENVNENKDTPIECPFSTASQKKRGKKVASRKKENHGMGRLKGTLHRENIGNRERGRKSSSCIVLSDSDFETPQQLREKKTSVAGKRKRTTKSASTSSHKKKRIETTSVGKGKLFYKDWSTGTGVKGSSLRKKRCSCLRMTRDACKKKKIEKAAKAKPNTEDRKQILVRTSPNTFANMLRALSDEQKQWVVDMGFESILSFSLTKFPLKLAYNVVWSFNMDNCDMDLLAGKIPITEDDVHEVLGLPQGPKRIQIVKNEDAEKSWRSQYKDAKKPWKVTAKRVYQRMKTSRDVDDHFKNNFLVMMCNMMIESQKNSFLNQSILGFRDIDRCYDYNWCEYLILNLHDPSEYWLVNPMTRYYYGPLPFLIYFYLDRVHNQRWKMIRRVPTFSGWTTLMIQQRQNYEEINKSFGIGNILRAMRLTNDSNNDTVNEDICGDVYHRNYKDLSEEVRPITDTTVQLEKELTGDFEKMLGLQKLLETFGICEDKIKEEPTPNEPEAENLKLKVRTNAIVLNLADNSRELKHVPYILLSK